VGCLTVNESVADRINAALPLWAKYEGYGTYALALAIFAPLMAAFTVWSIASGYQTAAWVFGIAGGLGISFFRYFQSAAKLRVKCQNCGRPAKGEDICPYCDARTYLQGDTDQ